MEKETTYYHVTEPFIDKVTGKTILPGSLFEATPERAQRLRSADVIGEEATNEEIAAFTGVDVGKKDDQEEKKTTKEKQTKGKGASAADAGGTPDGGKDADNTKES
ncbi:hypothetical protein GNQ08_20555 [Paenibacillus macerans]|uniref:Uncharacterized protein n=1 Tax=Paenibacillus macerans TaxID=44252 RepID=A0A6N8F1H9_PAEMA|nr:hypothetical protein [Paenibacillus macerans]MUG24763.1 hypothetical protein [Paenibacillus macerans]